MAGFFIWTNLMRFTVVVQSAPFAGTAAANACDTVASLLRQGHEVFRLFFYRDGVFNASATAVPPQNLPDLPAQWQALIENHALDAVICVSSALQRGILTEGEASRYEKAGSTIQQGFTLGGLGLLVEALDEADRVLTFG